MRNNLNKKYESYYYDHYCSRLVLNFYLCATIFGGSKYNAIVKVEGPTDTKIAYNKMSMGEGSAFIQIKRKDANKVNFTLSKEGCASKEISFQSRRFRGWAFVGSLALMPIVNGVPLPIPTIVDLATGAYYKPDKDDPQIFKSNYKNYNYILDYSECKTSTPSNNSQPPAKRVATKEEKLIELKEMFDNGLITEEEYKTSRLKVLEK